eukprot:TRINITY_DN8708_c0_g1_i1.p1 TRINITY_DN8708_c0_g1~~TRINITY_DN8708_c0_g1_i1.p1  ORF type:complete len:479 (-),score=44.87 TRINITY_DN8708_c0_g1_i1:229-1665(-)
MSLLLSLLTCIVCVTYAKHSSEWRFDGDQALKAGHVDDAITFFGKSIEMEPNDSRTRYKRATLYLKLHRYDSALTDINEILRKDAAFIEGFVHRGRIFALLGHCDTALNDFEHVVHEKPDHSQAKAQIPLMKECIRLTKEALASFEKGDCSHSPQLADSVLKISTESTSMLLIKSKCAMKRGDFHSALADTRLLLFADKYNFGALMIRARAFYYVSEFDNAINVLKSILRSDPEQKEAKTLHKQIKQFQRAVTNGDEAIQTSQWQEAVDQFDEALKIDPAHVGQKAPINEKLCQAYIKLNNAKAAIEKCTIALELDPNLVDARLSRAEAYLTTDNFQAAISDYQFRLKTAPNDGRAQQGMQRAQTLEKRKNMKDYYAILGCQKTSDERTIKKAFHNLALIHHPDKQTEPTQKAAAEARFRELSEAYEVLGNPETRARYDRGEDVSVNPEQAQQHQGFPFGGFPFGGPGGGPQFTFHFG